MNRPRLIRWLRVAVSAVCVVVCALLIALWVRSYQTNGVIIGDHWNFVDSFRGFVNINSGRGSLLADRTRFDPSFNGWNTHDPLSSAFLGFGIYTDRQSLSVMTPHWLPVLLFAAFAYVPWFPWSTRFSLRTMLIVTTVFAAVLGVVVWLSR